MKKKKLKISKTELASFSIFPVKLLSQTDGKKEELKKFKHIQTHTYTRNERDNNERIGRSKMAHNNRPTTAL